MCEQCVCETESWGEPLPGWFLVRATKSSDMMKVGDWGLVLSNDPSYVWTASPRPDPDSDFELRLTAAGMTEKEIDVEMEKRLDADKNWHERFVGFEAEQAPFEAAISQACPLTAYKLVNGCIGAGYRLDNDGRLSFWLFHYLGMWIKRFTPLSYHDQGTHIGYDDNDETIFDFTTHYAWETQFSAVPWHIAVLSMNEVKGKVPDYDISKVYTTLFPNPVS